MESLRERQLELSKSGLFPPPPPSFINAVTPYCEFFGFKSLPSHLHVVIGAGLFYHAIFLVSPLISAKFKSYNTLRSRSKINWDIHIVSMVQCILISALAFLALDDPQIKENRVFGYSRLCADVSAMACGYFIWDTYVSVKYAKHFGLGFALHGIASMIVFLFVFRPIVLYYAPAVLLFELSTPFLNVHWFSDKVNLTGSKVQIINGVILMATFFSCRVIWGWWVTYHFQRDLYAARQQRPEDAPLWLVGLYVFINFFLNFLNLYWFSKMIDSIRRRAEIREKATHEHKE